MKSFECEKLPIFINGYINKGFIDITDTHNFCRELLQTPFQISIDRDGKSVYTFEIDNYFVKKFADFYIEKSKLDLKYNCKYEDELDIPKSIMNEFFIFIIDGEKVSLYIDSYKNNKLVMKNL